MRARRSHKSVGDRSPSELPRAPSPASAIIHLVRTPPFLVPSTSLVASVPRSRPFIALVCFFSRAEMLGVIHHGVSIMLEWIFHRLHDKRKRMKSKISFYCGPISRASVEHIGPLQWPTVPARIPGPPQNDQTAPSLQDPSAHPEGKSRNARPLPPCLAGKHGFRPTRTSINR